MDIHKFTTSNLTECPEKTSTEFSKKYNKRTFVSQSEILSVR